MLNVGQAINSQASSREHDEEVWRTTTWGQALEKQIIDMEGRLASLKTAREQLPPAMLAMTRETAQQLNIHF